MFNSINCVKATVATDTQAIIFWRRQSNQRRPLYSHRKTEVARMYNIRQ